MRHFRKENLLRGKSTFWNSYKELKKRPRCNYPNFSCTLTCLSDLTDTLAPKQCYVVYKGRSLMGTCVVYRHPCPSPSDFEIWEAVPVPPHQLTSDFNVTVSAAGKAITELGGGDFDGDILSVVFCPLFIDVVRCFADLFESMDLQKMREEQKALLGEIACTEFDASPRFSRTEQYLSYANSMRNQQIRGKITTISERAAAQAIAGDLRIVSHKRQRSTANISRQGLFKSLQFAMLTHFATDVPKHYHSEQVFKRARDLSDGDVLRKAADRSSVLVAKHLPLQEAPILQRDIVPRCAPILQSHFDVKQEFGHYWLPHSQYVLGFIAGRLIGKYLLTQQQDEHYYDRSTTRTVCSEVACLMRHRFASWDLKEAILARDPAKINEAIDLCRKCATLSIMALERSMQA